MKKPLFLILLVFITCITNAQKFDPNFTDGRIWFKVKNTTKTTNQKKSNGKTFNFANELGQVPLEIKKLPIFSSSRSATKAFKFESPVKLNPALLPDLFYVEFNQTSKGELDDIIVQLLKSGLVEYAEKEPIFRTFLDPNDTHKNLQWSLTKVNASDAWELVKDKPFMTNGSSIIIAVVDDAINVEHEDLTDVVWINSGEIPDNGIDDDNNGYIDDYKGVDVSEETTSPLPPTSAFNHGTHVAGIAAAKSNNSKGVSSLAYNSKLMAIKATTEAGFVNAGYAGIIYAIENGAHIINCSWGGTTSSQVFQNIIDLATANNIIIVGAAGNSGNEVLNYPASYNGVISVANINQSDIVHSTSNYATRIDISAPGVNIYSTRSTTGYEYKTGTSMASPMVASLLGLMKSIDPSIPNDDIKGCLFSTAVDIEALNPTYAGLIGSGRIDARAAVSCVLSLLESPPIALFSSDIQQISTGVSINFSNHSGYSPTTFEWIFEGGTPSSYIGENPPPIFYNTAGTFDVTLNVSNDFGSHSVTKQNYITVTEGIPCESKNLDNTWDWGIYISSQDPNSWLFGTNTGRMIQEKAMFYDLSYSSATHITRTAVDFHSTSMNINNHSVVPLKIYDGTNGTPGALLYTDTSLTYSQIVNNILNNKVSIYYHPKAIQLPTSKKIFIAVDYTALCSTGDCNDDLTLIGTVDGQVTPNSSWEKLNNSWVQFGMAGSFNYGGNLSIYPYITNTPFNFDFNLPSLICLNQNANFDGTNINANGNWSIWFDDDVSNSITNTLNINKSFTTSGTHSININAVGGACQDQRINTQTFVVKDTPTVTHQILSALVCSGKETEISVEGADSYTWILPQFIAGHDEELLSIILNQTENITVVGTTEGCSSSYSFQIPVQESLITSVVLSSNTTIYEPNSTVTFTANGTNLGANPIYTFYVNDILQQAGNTNTYSLTNPQLGDKINVIASNLSGCVVDALPASNDIVLSMVTLPIYFDYFDAKANQNNNEITWRLSAQQVGQKVILEKSTNGITFEDFAEYDFISGIQKKVIDNDIQSLNFYRIKIINLDGSGEVSNALRIQRQLSSTINIYPTILNQNQKINIHFKSVNDHNYQIEFINNLGQILNTYKTSSSISIDTNNMKSGLYYIRIINVLDRSITIKKIIIQ